MATASPTRRGLRLRALEPADLAWTVPWHRAALPHNFFAGLGPRFLGAYQRTFLDSPFGIALGVERLDEPVGFLLGASDADGHRDWTLRDRRARLALLGLGCMVAHPRELARFGRDRAVRYARALAAARRGTRGYAGPPPPPAAVLKHVVVDPTRRRDGAGTLLVEAFVDEARRLGATRARLTTLRDEGAEAFWERLGWVPGGVVADNDDRPHRLFTRNL